MICYPTAPEEFIDRQVAALAEKAGDEALSDSQKVELMREQQELRRLKGQPIQSGSGYSFRAHRTSWLTLAWPRFKRPLRMPPARPAAKPEGDEGHAEGVAEASRLRPGGRRRIEFSTRAAALLPSPPLEERGRERRHCMRVNCRRGRPRYSFTEKRQALSQCPSVPPR